MMTLKERNPYQEGFINGLELAERILRQSRAKHPGDYQKAFAFARMEIEFCLDAFQHRNK